MIDKKTYLALKKEIKGLCRPNVLTLCDNMQLNKEEREMLMYFYDGYSRTYVCMKMSISTKYYRDHMLLIFTKIQDYKNTLM